jgi:hypothetical protein
MEKLKKGKADFGEFYIFDSITSVDLSIFISTKKFYMKLKLTICVLGIFLFNSCTTYFIPVQSLKSQLSQIDSTKFKIVKVQGPFGEKYNYLSNSLKTILCEDSKGNKIELKNSPSIEIRITSGKNYTKNIFYFDRIYLNDTCIIGVQSRFITSIRKTILLKDITKIEIQDGRKNFHYIQPN